MGMFSWKCAVSNKSVMNVHSKVGQLDPSLTRCYLVTPSKTYYESAYDGYGE